MVKAVIFDYGGVLRKRLVVQRKLLDFSAELRQKGIQTAVLSNMIVPIAAIFRNSSELRDFSPVIISCDVGIRKPNPEIYIMMLERLNLQANECVFIDNRADNIAAAKSLGFRVIHAKSTRQIIEDVNKLL